MMWNTPIYYIVKILIFCVLNKLKANKMLKKENKIFVSLIKMQFGLKIFNKIKSKNVLTKFFYPL